MAKTKLAKSGTKTKSKTNSLGSSVSKKVVPNDVYGGHYGDVPCKVHPVLAGYFGYCHAKSALLFRAELVAEYSKVGMQPPQAGLLDILSKSGPMNQLTLGEQMGVDKATMVKLIDGIEALGFITRKTHPTDRRAKIVEVTPAGKKVLPKLLQMRNKTEKEFLSGLTEQEAETYRELTFKLFLSRFKA